MLNKLCATVKTYQMIKPGDRVTVAVSGGADSMALLFALYLKKEELGIALAAAHFNHGLRGAESDADEAFVKNFCEGFSIPCFAGRGSVVAGKKGLEAAAREARYAFFSTLPGIIATAHTADDNAETVLLHLVRGTGLKGLGGIAPVNGRLIRPMLEVTRGEVLSFLAEYHVDYREDSSNAGDDFLRNRLRHHVLPLLKAENPRFAENTSAMAQRLRQDEAALAALAEYDRLPDVCQLRQLPNPVQSRILEQFLKKNGVKEPEAAHIAMARKLLYSDHPSASAQFPGGVCLCRVYDRLTVQKSLPPLTETCLPRSGTVELPGWRVVTATAEKTENTQTVFTVCPQGEMVLRSRCQGDSIRLPGGTRSLKKLFVDRKIPAGERANIPVLADDGGILGVYGIGADCGRKAETLPAVRIQIIKTEG